MSIITGKSTNDSLLGTSKEDTVSGLAGNDTIRGAGGNDLLSGGTGNDIFVFEATRTANGFDTITDYTQWNGTTGDRINLSALASFTSKSLLSDFVYVEWVDNELMLYVDPDGSAGAKYGFQAWAAFGDQNLGNGGGNMRIIIGSMTFDLAVPINNQPPVVDAQPSFTSTGVTLSATDPDADALTLSLNGTSLGSFTNAVEKTLVAQANILNGVLSIEDGQAPSVATDTYLALGTAGGDTLNYSAQSGRTAIYGFGGNDIITGGTGNDSIFAGAGNDLLVYTSAAALVGDGAVSGGLDTDTIRMDSAATAVSLADANFAHVTGVEIVAFNGTGTQAFTLGANTNAAFAAGITITTQSAAAGLNLAGGLSTVAINATGTDNADTLSGGSANDTLNGGGGADSITGGTGMDSLSAGAGNDVLVGEQTDVLLDGGVDNADALQVDANFNDTGNGQIINIEIVNLTAGGLAVTLDAQTDSFTINGFATGTSSITGGSGNDTINGGDANDFVKGGTGVDSLSGAGGNDSMFGDDQDALIDGGSGSDVLTVVASFNDSSDGQLTGVESINLTATGLTVSMDAQTEDLYIQNYGGAGTMIGGSGNDAMYGGAGADSIVGGGGNDSLIGAQNDIVLDGGSGAADMLAIFTSNFDDTSDGQIVNIELVEMSTSNLAVSLDAQTENLSIHTNGNSTLIAGSGNDTITGAVGNDSVTGGAGSDSIFGGFGNDTLVGGVGNDSLDGGANNDVLVFDAAATLAGDATVIGGSDSDTIRIDSLATALSLANADFLHVTQVEILALNGTGTQAVTLGANTNSAFSTGITITTQSAATSLNLAGTASTVAITATGTDNADTLTGGSAADALNGGSGNDTITGGGGVDALNGGAGADQFKYGESGALNRDVISGFTLLSDTIMISSGVLSDGTVSWTLSNAHGSDYNGGGGSVSAGGLYGVAMATNGVVNLDQDLDGIGGNQYGDYLFLSSTAATNFFIAVGTGTATVSGFSGVESLLTIWYDSTNAQAVIGLVTPIYDGTFANVSAYDKFVEIVRIGMISTDYTIANIDAMLGLF